MFDTFAEFHLYVLDEVAKHNIGHEHPIDYIGRHFPFDEGLILEFGVAGGSTLGMIHRYTKNLVIGFDSFQGLPETWRDGFHQGTFSSGGSIPNVPEKTVIVKGMFEDTLPLFKKIIGFQNIAFMHIDCDLYSSTKTIFTLLRDNITPGTIIEFDELINYPGYEEHELKAFFEFLQETNYSFQVLAWRGEQVAIQIT